MFFWKGVLEMSLDEQASEILKIAEQHGVEQNFLFLTTFKRYQVQLKILSDLKEKINESGALVTKNMLKEERTYTRIQQSVNLIKLRLLLIRQLQF